VRFSMITSIWAVDDGIRVMRDEVNHWSKSDTVKNVCWQNGGVTLFGAKNEVVAFQLMISADSATTGIDVKLEELMNGGAQIKNTSNDPLQYVGRNIELFVEHYLHVTERMSKFYNRGAGGDGSTGAEPATSNFIGWVPDALVPIEAASKTYTNGQGGAPFTVGADQVQGVWVDIYIPKTLPAGTFTGNLVVSQTGTVVKVIPVTLVVYNFALSDDTHFPTIFFGGGNNIIAHTGTWEAGDATWWAYVKKYKQMMHRHRQNLIFDMDYATMVANFGQYFTGAGYSSASGYAGPGQDTGDNLYPIGMYCETVDRSTYFGPPTEAGFRAQSDQWESWFLANAPKTIRFKYAIDEPDANAPVNWPVVIERLKWIKNNPGVGKGLKVGVTNRLDPAWQVGGAWISPDPVGNGMDIFIEAAESAKWTGYHTNKYSTPPVQGMTVEDVRAKGRMIGSYNGYRPDYGLMPALDVPATEHRVPLWVFYRYHTDLYLLWETAYWATKPGSDPITRVGAPNPWSDPHAQGAGWIYSGEDTYFTGDNRGLKGPIASVRMKTFRRGLQDYEYLWMAENVKHVDVTAMVTDIVPAAYDDNITDPRYNTLDASKMYPVWAEDNYRMEAKRKQLAVVLSDGVIPPDPVLTPPTVVTQPVPSTVALGKPTTFTVVATGTPPLTYQWRKKVGATFEVIAGATDASYTFTPVLADNDASYACVVSNGVGTKWSNAAILLVEADPPYPVPPVIVVQPQAVTVTEGQAAMFDITATGVAPLAYQWKRGGLFIVGALASHLIISPTFLTDNGASIVCEVSDAGGVTSSVAVVLTVLPAESPDYKRGYSDGLTVGRIDGFVEGEKTGRMIGLADLQYLLPLVHKLNWDIALLIEGLVHPPVLLQEISTKGIALEKTINVMIQELL
jgi:hypothetical protein